MYYWTPLFCYHFLWVWLFCILWVRYSVFILLWWIYFTWNNVFFLFHSCCWEWQDFLCYECLIFHCLQFTYSLSIPHWQLLICYHILVVMNKVAISKWNDCGRWVLDALERYSFNMLFKSHCNCGRRKLTSCWEVTECISFPFWGITAVF